MSYILSTVLNNQPYYRITEIEGIEDVTEDNPIILTFNQATVSENLERDQFITVPIERKYDDLGWFDSDLRENKTLLERYSFEVWLTMSSCDVMETEDKPLFSFANKKSKIRIRETFDKFLNRWGRLPVEIAFAIHDKALEANPAWGLNYLSPDNDEETTEGNEVAED